MSDNPAHVVAIRFPEEEIAETYERALDNGRVIVLLSCRRDLREPAAARALMEEQYAALLEFAERLRDTLNDGGPQPS